jgi:hypothetical protein
MTKLLKQIPSGYIYVWTPLLAERADMVPFEQENTRENPVVEAAVAQPEPEVSKAIEAFRAKHGGRKAKPKPGVA